MEHTENIKQNSLHQWDILISAIKITFYELKKNINMQTKMHHLLPVVLMYFNFFLFKSYFLAKVP